MPPAKEAMKFDEVVCPTPYAISAGDPVGHMGYYQAPKDGGYEARYQVHIECTSMDDNLEKFLTNPEQVGEKNPLWLKYTPDLTLYKKEVVIGTFTKDTRVTTRTVILPLSQVQTDIDKTTRQEYWQLRPENAYALKGQAEPQLLSQYDLGKLGFRTETAEPTSFDYLDGKNQPTGFFRNLIDSLYQAATDDTRTSHALVKHNYQRLLDKIDSGSDRYSPMEYWRALHNPDYRDVIQKAIVKHPSDWYFKKGDAIWQPFLNALKKDAPEWKKYSEDFLDKMAWMQDVTTEKMGPSLWHMHPIMFLGALKLQHDIDWSKLTKQQFTDAVYEAALKEQEKSGIPAAITTAQAIDESGYGCKVPVDLNNKTYSFNLFGIKAKSGQKFVEIWTTEHINGGNIKIKDKFAAYDSFEESIADRTRFLTENKRYTSLFESDDPEKWSHGLQNKGYATDPNYASKLISIMKGSYMKSRGLK